jgi:hypothetical protein
MGMGMEMEILDDGIWKGRNDWGSETSLLDTLHPPLGPF